MEMVPDIKLACLFFWDIFRLKVLISQPVDSPQNLHPFKLSFWISHRKDEEARRSRQTDGDEGMQSEHRPAGEGDVGEEYKMMIMIMKIKFMEIIIITIIIVIIFKTLLLLILLLLFS